jgi:hypothetical protein
MQRLLLTAHLFHRLDTTLQQIFIRACGVGQYAGAGNRHCHESCQHGRKLLLHVCIVCSKPAPQAGGPLHTLPSVWLGAHSHTTWAHPIVVGKGSVVAAEGAGCPHTPRGRAPLHRGAPHRAAHRRRRTAAASCMHAACSHAACLA